MMCLGVAAAAVAREQANSRTDRKAQDNDAAVTLTPGAVEAGATATRTDFARTLVPKAVVQGQGRMTWFGMRIYDASLWVSRDTAVGDRFGGSEFVLELRYARRLEGAAIAERSGDEIARLGIADEGTRAIWVDRMRGVFPDVIDGDRIAAWHRPGKPTRFYLNGKPLGEIGDPGFAIAFFSIWFDEKTSQPALRDALLKPAMAAAPKG